MLSYYYEIEMQSTVGHVLFESGSVSRGTEIYLKLGMEQDTISFQLQLV